jgi:hypothetical protein
MSNHKPSPNDQRSNVKNPNNPAFKQDRDHRSVQLNPSDPRNAPPAPTKPVTEAAPARKGNPDAR